MFNPMLIESYKAELLRYAKKSESASHVDSGPALTTPATAPDAVKETAPPLQIPASVPSPPPFPSEKNDAIRFLREHPDSGLLRVQVTDSIGAAVGGATVAVAVADSGAPALCAVPTNDIGVADGIALPANASGEPFARYDIAVAHPLYEPAHFTGVAIFRGVKSIQQAHLTLRKSIDKADSSAVL